MAKIVHVQSARIRKDKDGNVKPNHKCELHGEEIKPGDSYKHVTIKTGPRSSHTRYRCAASPNWKRWELSSSLDARVEQIQYEGANSLEGAETKDDFESMTESLAEEIEGLAEEKRESGQNMEDGFGHPTQQSESLEEIADSLDEWAQAIRDAANNLDDAPEENDASYADDPEQYEDDLEQWQESARDEVQQALDDVSY